MMDLQGVLLWVLSGGGVGVLTYWLMEKVPVLAELAPKWKRLVSLALPVVLAAGAWLLSVAMAYTSRPESWQGYVEGIFAAVTTALLVSQGWHGLAQLPGRD